MIFGRSHQPLAARAAAERETHMLKFTLLDNNLALINAAVIPRRTRLLAAVVVMKEMPSNPSDIHAALTAALKMHLITKREYRELLPE